MSSVSVRVKRHKLRQAAGVRVVSIEVPPDAVAALEVAGLLPADGEHTRVQVAQAIEELLRRLTR